jgi:hypothetical protein
VYHYVRILKIHAFAEKIGGEKNVYSLCGWR